MAQGGEGFTSGQPLVPPHGWPFTARTDELRDIGAGYEDVEQGGVLVVGVAGVGKTRLAEEAVRLAERAGLPTARASGHAAMRDIPLGALAHLLPSAVGELAGSPRDARTLLFHRARVELTALGAGDRLILFVDDVDLVDDTSLALVVSLVTARSVFLIGTIRSTRAPRPELSDLARQGHLRRLELAPLDPDGVDTLLHRALDAPMTPAALDELQRLSQGNLQILRELVLGGLRRGTLRAVDGVWDMFGPATTTTELEELIADHLDAVDPTGMEVLELLSVCERLGLADLEHEFGIAALQRLERDGVVELVTSGRRTLLRPAHPLYAEVVAARLTPLGLRTVHHRLADLLERHGVRRREDQVRSVLWRLSSGGTVPAERAIAAARLALVAHDPSLAARIMEPELVDATTAQRAHRLNILGGASARLGRLTDAERHFGAALAMDVDDALRAAIAIGLADARFALGLDLDRALQACAEAAAQIGDRGVRSALDARRAILLATGGRPADALGVLDRLSDTDATISVDVDAARSTSLIAVGRYDEAADVARAAAARQAQLPRSLSGYGAARHVVNEAHALTYAGHYAAARRLLADAERRARASRATAAWVWFEMVRAELARETGRGGDAVRHGTAVVEAAPGAGLASILVWAHVAIGEGHLLRGDCGAAARALASAEEIGDSPVAASRHVIRRGRAWLTACRGDLTAATEMLITTAAALAADGIKTYEAALLHDAARFGGAEQVVDRLGTLSSQMQGPIVGAFARHARALADDDPDGLLRCADEFESLDSLAWAAEAAAEAAERLQVGGRSSLATEAGRRAAALAARAGGVSTPPVRRGAEPEPLTTRELEIARLAASGLTSKEIARREQLSARTVDTHLARVYRKLGIGGRAELPSALERARHT